MKRFKITVAVSYATDERFDAIDSKNMSLDGITAYFKTEVLTETYEEACEKLNLEELDIQECEGLFFDSAIIEHNAEIEWREA